MYASFKITASKYSLKPLLKLVTSAFKIIYKQVESFYEQITFFYGMKFLFDIFKQSASDQFY